jgi:membrane protein required for beta-lactamase induction
MKRLLDWIAAKLGYTSKDYAGLLEEQVDAWREAYTDAQRRYSFAQDRLNRLMRYKHVQAVAKTLDEGKPRK